MVNYDNQFTVNQSLPNALTGKNIKPGYLVTGIWLLNTDMYSDEDFSPSAVTDRKFKIIATLKIMDSHNFMLQTQI
jgi:hypothetical protein